MNPLYLRVRLPSFGPELDLIIWLVLAAAIVYVFVAVRRKRRKRQRK